MAQGGASYDINTPDSTTVYKSCYNSLSTWTSPQGNQLAPTCQKYRMAFHAALKRSSMPPQASKPWLKVMRILGYIQIRPWNHLPNFCVSPTPPLTSMTVLGIRCRVCALKAQSSGFQACPLRYTGWPHEEHFNPLLPLLPKRKWGERKPVTQTVCRNDTQESNGQVPHRAFFFSPELTVTWRIP